MSEPDQALREAFDRYSAAYAASERCNDRALRTTLLLALAESRLALSHELQRLGWTPEPELRRQLHHDLIAKAAAAANREA